MCELLVVVNYLYAIEMHETYRRGVSAILLYSI